MYRPLFISVTALIVLGPACGGQARDSTMAGMDSTDRHATAAAEQSMTGPMHMDPHMAMTPARMPAPGDSPRAAQLLADMRRGLARYKDVNAAIADGYRQFLPNVKDQPVYHYTNWLNAIEERRRFDPTKPTSLLYRRGADGALVLIGAMYDDRRSTSLDELDRRVPLSIAHWHRHVNWCIPPAGRRQRWRDSTDGHPVFGPRSPIATQAAAVELVERRRA